MRRLRPRQARQMAAHAAHKMGVSMAQARAVGCDAWRRVPFAPGWSARLRRPAPYLTAAGCENTSVRVRKPHPVEWLRQTARDEQAIAPVVEDWADLVLRLE